jgi:hypothetical protein
MWCLPFAWTLCCLHLTKKLRSSSIYEKNWGRLPFTKTIEVSFHLPRNSGHLPFSKWGRLPFKKIKVVFHKKIIEVVFHLQKNWGRLAFTKEFRSSSITRKLMSSISSLPAALESRTDTFTGWDGRDRWTVQEW